MTKTLSAQIAAADETLANQLRAIRALSTKDLLAVVTHNVKAKPAVEIVLRARIKDREASGKAPNLVGLKALAELTGSKADAKAVEKAEADIKAAREAAKAAKDTKAKAEAPAIDDLASIFAFFGEEEPKTKASKAKTKTPEFDAKTALLDVAQSLAQIAERM